MRQIYPVRPGETVRLLGPADPLPARITPSSPDAAAAGDLIAALGEIYAYPAGQWVRANMVASVDGAISLDGRSAGLSGPADRLVFSVLRSLSDVVLVGAGTARTEGYRQAQPDELWQPLRAGRPPAPPVAVVTRRLDLDLAGPLFRSEAAGTARTIVLTTELVPDHRLTAAARVADVIVAGADGVTAGAAVGALAGRGHRAILVEGGPTLLGQLAAGRLLDELCLTISPVLEGGVSVPRITSRHGQARADQMRLAALIEDDGFLLSRYVSAR